MLLFLQDGNEEESDNPPESASRDVDGNSSLDNQPHASQNQEDSKKIMPEKPPEPSNKPGKKKKRRKKKGKGNSEVPSVENDGEDVDKLIAELNLQTVRNRFSLKGIVIFNTVPLMIAVVQSQRLMCC